MATLFRFKHKGKPPSISHVSYEDPFSRRAIPEESEEEKRQKLKALQEATRVSREIDQSLLETKKLLDKKKKATKILLLGQSESGKSSLLKNFQLAFAPNSFQSERAVWKVVIQLNLIRSIKTILGVLQRELDVIDSTTPSTSGPPLPLTDNHRRIRLGLSPLLSIESALNRMLAPSNRDSDDVCVRAGGGWKGTLAESPNGRSKTQRPKLSSPVRDNEATYVLAASRDNIIALWGDPIVRDMLRKYNIRLEDSPGFFLNDTTRITDCKYEPTNCDIIRARVRTMGVEEHRFVLESGRDLGNEVYITDVSGSRGQRSSWVPFFDDVHAILFLAPLSFNQTLEEDPTVNRLEDSLCLWREICQNKLLAKANIILFFNKMDILAANLAAGMVVKKYVPSYGDLPNDVAHVTKYFHNKFRAYHKKLSPEPRPFLCYETSAIDTSATSVLLVGVHEAILRSHLERLRVI